MGINRRKFFRVTSALPLAATTLGAAPVKPPAKVPKNPIAEAAKQPIPQIPPLVPIPGPAVLQAGPMLGHLSEKEAGIWLQSSKAAQGRIELALTADFEKILATETFDCLAKHGLSVSVRFGQLQAETLYYYRIILEGRDLMSAQPHQFTTTALPDQPGKLRFAFSSCVGRLPVDASAAFGEMADRADFDLLLMLGDNHYGDTTDLERQRLYYTAFRQLAGYRALGAKRPIYGIWDDHDFGPNNSDGTAEGKEQSLQAFHEYWCHPTRREHPEDPAIYYHFERAGVAFFMLDVRWHRSPNSAPDGPDKTMLGKTQLEWLKRAMKASTAKIKILASGSEWQTKGHRDSWTSFDHERRHLWDWLEAEQIRGVIFVSGDRHFCAGYHLRQRWPEFTSGPLGSPNERNAKAVVTSESFTLRNEGKMWMVLDIDTRPEVPKVCYEIWEAGEGLIETLQLPEKMVLGEITVMEKTPLVEEMLELQRSSQQK